MELEYIKKEIDKTLQEIDDEITKIIVSGAKIKLNYGKYSQKITSKLKTILGNPINNPIMKYDEAKNYYFECENALENIENKYITIIELQDYIINKSNTVFIYDKYIVCKILAITQDMFNSFTESCKNGVYDEDICNLFLDIEVMLISDRNASAENYTKNFKAIDTFNKYSKNEGGYGISNGKNINDKNIVINVTPEEAKKKIFSFGYSDLLEKPKENKNDKNNK